MDTNSSGEDLIIKARKPYTITKQRERWTEEEHNRFLEALKLYGRAWQRIEEHIGTKTAVQIRSHAQKFFSKLEKEALVKGGEALDIDIPPPRPKRKPSNPYPRKTCVSAPTSQLEQKGGKSTSFVSSARHVHEMLDLEKEPLSEEAPSVPVPTVNKNSTSTPMAIRNSCTYREFMLSVKDVGTQNGNNGSLSSDKPTENQQVVQDNGANAASNLCNPHTSGGRILSSENTGKVCYLENFGPFQTADLEEASRDYPRNVPVHVLDQSLGRSCQIPALDKSHLESITRQMGGVGLPDFINSAASANNESQDISSSSTLHQSFPTSPFTFNTVQNNQDDHKSFLQISAAFSSLIVSSLLQNPAAHAAASFAASFWPCGTNGGNSADSPPSMAAIAAATVAAATAWWAAHGMLPLCASSLHSGFPCAPMSATIAPSVEASEALAANNNATKDYAPKRSPSLQDPKQDPPEHSEALQACNSSDSEETGAAKLNSIVEVPGHGHEKKAAILASVDRPADASNREESRKQVDRSSCGSNTASSSEVETDALRKDDEKEKGKDEPKEPDAKHPVSSESSYRRGRSVCNLNDSWKEVSEEGRLAFQALFNREVLPQSFSPPHALKNKELQRVSGEEDESTAEKGIGASQLDLNSQTRGSCSLASQEMEKFALLRGDFNGEEGMLSLGLGHGQGRLKARRTGFKPYKRCSVEAKEGRVGAAGGQSEEKCPKRIRLEGETSV